MKCEKCRNADMGTPLFVWLIAQTIITVIGLIGMITGLIAVIRN
jgi:hypothetical protein